MKYAKTRVFTCLRIVSVELSLHGPPMVLGSPVSEMKQIEVNAFGRVALPGGDVAELSRHWLGHGKRQDAAATLRPAHGGAASLPPRQGARTTAWTRLRGSTVNFCNPIPQRRF